MILSRSFRDCWSSYGFKNEVAMDPLNVLSSWYILSNFVFFPTGANTRKEKAGLLVPAEADSLSLNTDSYRGNTSLQSSASWDGIVCPVDPPIISTWVALYPWFLIKPKCLMVPGYNQGLFHIIEGSLEVKLPTIWKSRGGKSQRREEKRREEERRSGKRKSQKTEDAGARKGSKVAKHCVFQMMCGSGGSKSSLAKAASASTHVVWKWDIKLETGRCDIIHIRY